MIMTNALRFVEDDRGDDVEKRGKNHHTIVPALLEIESNII